MKNIAKLVVCLITIVSLQTIGWAQTAYSITDRNRDATGLEQLFYSFDINTGNATLLGSIGANQAREYEGFASIGSVLYGVSEGDNAIPSDVRIFGPTRPEGLLVGTTGITTATGNEVGTAYNPIDGFIYSISSNDAFAASGVRSTLFRISPSTGAATQIAAITGTGAGADANPYLDGMAILPNGVAFASECRFSGGRGGLYQLNLTTGVATFRGNFAPITCAQGTETARDTGLANVGNQLYLLLEDGRIFTTTQTGGSTPTGQINVNGTNIGGDFEAFDIPQPGVN